MKINLVCLAVIIATVIQSSYADCDESGFLTKTKCHLSAAGEKIKDVAVSAYDGLADGYDTLKSKITGNPKTTENFDVRTSTDDDSAFQSDDSTIVFPTSSETISVDDRAIFQVPTLEANCPPGTRSDSKGRCRVYS